MLTEMIIENFCCYSFAKLDLAKQGLVWVGGENQDTAAASSNGSGKSTLFKALEWGLYGETIDKKKGDEVIKVGEKSATVNITLDGGWRIIRVRKKGSPRVALSKDGAPFHGKKKDIQSKINEILGMDHKTFKNTVLFGQNDTARFSDPAVKDTERKDMLKRLLGVEVIEQCYVIARAKRLDANNRLFAAENDMKTTSALLAEADADLKSCAASAASWGRKRDAEVRGMVANVRALKARAADVVRDTPDVSALRVEIVELEKSVSAADRARKQRQKALDRKEPIVEERNKVSVRIRDISRDVKSLRATVSGLNGETCPVCTSPLDGEHASKHIASTKSEIERLQEESAQLQDEQGELWLKAGRYADYVEKCERLMEVGRRASRKIPALQSRINEAERTTEKSEAILKEARSEIARAKAKRAEKNPHTPRVKGLDKKVKNYYREKLEIGEKIEALKVEVERYSFWANGFSGKGLPSYIFDAVMPLVTERANHYLKILSNGDIIVEFNTQKEKKSAKGEFVEEITINWTIEGIEDHPPSGGQQRKIEIATDLALMDLVEMREGSKLDLFIADEILDGLDSEGVDRVLALLKELRSKRGTIFIVSHQPSISEVFEKAITAIKKGGQTRLEFLS